MIRRKVLAAFVACIAIVGAAPRALPQNGAGNAMFLWKVTATSGAEAWLFGSIHAGTKDMYPLPGAIDKAFGASKKLVVEVDVENLDSIALQSLIITKGRYPQGDSLSKHVKKETLALLRIFSEKNGMSFEAMERTKPWLITLTISNRLMQDVGLDPELGLDKYFLRAANTARKDILEIEGIERQLDVLSSLSDVDQEANLVAGLTDLPKGGDQMTGLVRAWKNGDATALEEISASGLRDHPETKPAYEALLNKRNEGMVEKIEGYLKTKDTHFVVVGALHLVGEKGLVNVLQAKNYKVEQVKGK